jgi:hypothetical protein
MLETSLSSTSPLFPKRLPSLVQHHCGFHFTFAAILPPTMHHQQLCLQHISFLILVCSKEKVQLGIEMSGD